MTNFQIIKKIAKFCGWKKVREQYKNGPIQGIEPFTGRCEFVPDYLHDLNAIHEAEQVLRERNKYAEFVAHLANLVPTEDPLIKTMWHNMVYATAEQRARAFVKTISDE